MFTILNRR